MSHHRLAAVLALLACLASCTQAAAPAVCAQVSGRMGVIIGRTNPPWTTLTCGLGSAPNTRMVYKPTVADTRFVPANFAKTCVANAGVGCDDQSNTADTVLPAVQTSCSSCSLYAEFCADFRRPKYVVNNKHLKPPTVTHVLVMPTDPCTGVENYNRGRCPGEELWDQGQAEIDSARQSGNTSSASWGMAVDPVSRRTQHQMHIHLAQPYPSLMASIAHAHHALKLKAFQLDCGTLTATTRLAKCKVAQSADSNNPQVTTVSAIKAPSEASPFKLAYGSNPDNTNPNVLWASTLVAQVPGDSSSYAVVRNVKGAAACFFQPQGDAELTQGCQ